jgi:hypothetical protein
MGMGIADLSVKYQLAIVYPRNNRQLRVTLRDRYSDLSVKLDQSCVIDLLHTEKLVVIFFGRVVKKI